MLNDSGTTAYLFFSPSVETFGMLLLIHVLVTSTALFTCIPFVFALPHPSYGDVLPANITAFHRNTSNDRQQFDSRRKHKRNGDDESVSGAADKGRIDEASFDIDNKVGNINGKKVSLEQMITTSSPVRLGERKLLVTSKDNKTLGILRVIYPDEVPPKVLPKVERMKKILQLLEPDRFMWDQYIDEAGQAKVYMVLIKNMHGTVNLGDNSTDPPVTLRTLTEWTLEKDWDEKIMLPRCLERAIQEHEMLLEKNLVIDNYRLSEWVADIECKHWLPIDVQLGYRYRKGVNLELITVKGARLLIDKKGEVKEDQKKSYKKTLRETLEPYFTPRNK